MADEPSPEVAAPEAPPTTEPVDEPNAVHVDLLERMRGGGLGGDAIVETAEVFGDLVVRVAPEAWHQAARVAREGLECDYLSFVAGIDWLPAPSEGDGESGDTSSPVQPTETTYGAAGSAGWFQVFAHVQSTRRHWGVTFKTDVDDDAPRIASWVDVYPGADWHERECWEMYGVTFEGHPDLRHLYLPAEFEGHPLRKDFPLLARVVKPWPGLVNVEAMPGEAAADEPPAADEVDQ